MLLPNKFLSLRESVLGEVPTLFRNISRGITVIDLYKKTQDSFDCIDHFLYALDILYVTGKINVDFSTRVITNVD